MTIEGKRRLKLQHLGMVAAGFVLGWLGMKLDVLTVIHELGHVFASWLLLRPAWIESTTSMWHQGSGLWVAYAGHVFEVVFFAALAGFWAWRFPGLFIPGVALAGIVETIAFIPGSHDVGDAYNLGAPRAASIVLLETVALLCLAATIVVLVAGYRQRITQGIEPIRRNHGRLRKQRGQRRIPSAVRRTETAIRRDLGSIRKPKAYAENRHKTVRR